jgi:hypothetical protein
MTMKLNISDDLKLPLEAVTETFAVMGIRGSGKTHTASVMAEEMLKAGQPIVVYDPTGAWFGLKTSADGKRPGFPVVIFGGEHPDVPLEESAGETIAKVIVEKRFPAILDVSLMRKGARIHFMQDFCETLYHQNRQALHFFVDEAHTIAPQRVPPTSKGEYSVARVLGAMEDIVLQGRRRGLGMTAISQRPALVNTNIRTQCSTLIAMRIVGPHDLKAIEEWTEAHGTPERTAEMMKTLAVLGKGEGWVWSVWLDLFKRLRFRRRETFDSSATPEVGKSVAAPKVVADIDLDALGAQIKSTVERAKENDPKALKLELAKLRQQLAARPKEQVEKIVEKIVERPAIDAKTLKETESIVERLEREGAKQIEAGNRLVEAAKLMAAALRATAQPMARAVPIVRPVVQHVPVVREQRQPRSAAVATDRLPKGERRVLTAIAQFDGGLDKTHLMTLTGYKRRSRDDYVFRLKQRGFVAENGETVTATPDGVSALGDDFQPLPTGEALRSYWMQRLPQGERRVLEVLISAYPNPIAKEQIETETGYARRSRDDYLYRLGARRLVENVGRGEVKASDQLF